MMKELPAVRAQQLLVERFQKDCIISLATLFEARVYVRQVDAYYENGSFYLLTCRDSRKIRHIQAHPQVGVAAEWFEATGTAHILGDFRSPQNKELFEKLAGIFRWFDRQTENYPTPYSLIIRVDVEEADVIEKDHECRMRFMRDTGSHSVHVCSA